MTLKYQQQESAAAHINVATMSRLIKLAGSDFEAFFGAVAIESAKLVGADGAALILKDTDGMMRYKFFHGLPQSFQQNFITDYCAQDDFGTIGQALKQNKCIFTADYASSPHAVQQFIDSGLKANLIIPIHTENQNIPTAALAISWFNTYPEHKPDHTQLEIINLFCDLLQAGLARQTIINDLKFQATRDALTGLPNRRALMEYLPPALARARRSGKSVAVCIMDLDDFKSVNDTYGHAAGDALLMELAHRLKLAIRTTDMVVRLGGDEFVLVLENIESIPHMEATLKRLRAAICQPVELLSDHYTNISMSLGVTLFPDDDSTPDYLLRHADNALYTIKKHKGSRSSYWHLWQKQNRVQTAS